MLRAKDVMTTSVIAVTPETTLFATIKLMLENNVSGLPVVDDQNCVVGVLSEYDAISLLYGADSRTSYVKNYMTRDVVGCDAECSLGEIVDLFLQQSMRRVPIVTDGKLVGVVSRRDLVRRAYENANENPASVEQVS